MKKSKIIAQIKSKFPNLYSLWHAWNQARTVSSLDSSIKKQKSNLLNRLSLFKTQTQMLSTGLGNPSQFWILRVKKWINPQCLFLTIGTTLIFPKLWLTRSLWTPPFKKKLGSNLWFNTMASRNFYHKEITISHLPGTNSFFWIRKTPRTYFWWLFVGHSSTLIKLISKRTPEDIIKMHAKKLRIRMEATSSTRSDSSTESTTKPKKSKNAIKVKKQWFKWVKYRGRNWSFIAKLKLSWASLISLWQLF